MMTLVIIEGLVILGLAVLVAGLLRSHAEILRRLHDLGAGDSAAAVELGSTRHARAVAEDVPPIDVPSHLTGVTPDGNEVSVALASSRGHTLLAFLSSGCTTCQAIWSALAEPHLDTPFGRVVIVTKSPDDESISAIGSLAPPTITTVMSTAAWHGFRVPYTPYFALVDARQGRILGDGAARSWDQVMSLVGRSLSDGDIEAARNRGRTTQGRLADSEAELRRAGIEPGDPALHQRPDSTT